MSTEQPPRRHETGARACDSGDWLQVQYGWAMWNFRGSFGVLDSGRDDVEYEDWHGRKLDRKLLTLLQKH